MTVNFIRHSYTAGNLRKAYIGITDEPLCSEGIELISSIKYPACTVLAVSPMRRCRETAGLIYGDRSQLIVDGFRECDFGHFEGRNYIEMENDAEYQSWINSGGKDPFPGGENVLSFRARCIRAFKEFIHEIKDTETVSLVVHGGTIMAIMEKLALPVKDFYDWHVDNGCGYTCEFDGNNLKVTGSIGNV